MNEKILDKKLFKDFGNNMLDAYLYCSQHADPIVREKVLILTTNYTSLLTKLDRYFKEELDDISEILKDYVDEQHAILTKRLEEKYKHL